MLLGNKLEQKKETATNKKMEKKITKQLFNYSLIIRNNFFVRFNIGFHILRLSVVQSPQSKCYFINFYLTMLQLLICCTFKCKIRDKK